MIGSKIQNLIITGDSTQHRMSAPLSYMSWQFRGNCDIRPFGCQRGKQSQSITSITKKYFRPGRMAPSEWTRSVRAIRDTQVADYSAPGINSACRIPYRPLIALSPFLLILSVSYFKRSLWHCGQLCPSVRMGSLGTRLHRDCNAMGDTAKISPRVPSTCAQNAILSLLIIRDCKAMGDAAKMSPRVPSTCAQNFNSLFTNYTGLQGDG